MTAKITLVAAVAAAVGVTLTAAPALAASTPMATLAAHNQVALSPWQAAHAAPPGGIASRRSATATALSGRRTFGPDCQVLAHKVPGSKARLAATPVASALGRTPDLSELAHAVQLAGLTRMLNTATALTLFAPDNAAFQYFGSGNLHALLATKPDLIRVLKFHLVAGRVPPAEFAGHHVLTTVAGTKLYLAHAGPSFGVNNAPVTCGNVQTSNATVYVVSRLVVPG